MGKMYTARKEAESVMHEKIMIQSLLDLTHTMAREKLEALTYPWEALPKIAEWIVELGNQLPEEEYEQRGENVWISKTATIFPTAYIAGPTIIGPNSEVRHGAFIRGKALVGKNCVVGNSVELKNVILFDNVQVPHYNYVGDSILGYKAHMGAGSITSNVKSDKTLVTVRFDGKQIETHMKKFGAIVGDFVEVGCNTVLNPGTIVGRGTGIYPVSMVRGYVEANSIYKNAGEIVTQEPLKWPKD